MNWLFSKQPTEKEVDDAVASAKKSMQPNPLRHVEDIDLGSYVMGNLMHVAFGVFVNPADIVEVYIHHDKSGGRILLRNGHSFNLSRSGAEDVALVLRMHSDKKLLPVVEEEDDDDE